MKHAYRPVLRATLLITSILLDVDLDLKQTGAILCQAMQRKLSFWLLFYLIVINRPF